ncbi:unnamed protein product [Gongylonema pulchrum]|uniref:Uncharacterized protein n=1 Tax=Gongylonema pulchrum TaxID=637853 RepID=A0A183E2T1_9BILA|nr:unnamed protein product [Gongylonema pulchrum]
MLPVGANSTASSITSKRRIGRVILKKPNFEHTILRQRISPMLPLAFIISISGTSERTLRVSLKSRDDICAVAVLQNSSVSYSISCPIALEYFAPSD